MVLQQRHTRDWRLKYSSIRSLSPCEAIRPLMPTATLHPPPPPALRIAGVTSAESLRSQSAPSPPSKEISSSSLRVLFTSTVRTTLSPFTFTPPTSTSMLVLYSRRFAPTTVICAPT